MNGFQATFGHIYILRWARRTTLVCKMNEVILPDTEFEIRALEVRARYLLVTEAPHNNES